MGQGEEIATAIFRCQREVVAEGAEENMRLFKKLWMTKEMLDEERARADNESARADEEFELGFVKGYSNLKARILKNHPDWDLGAYDAFESDFWLEDLGKCATRPQGLRMICLLVRLTPPSHWAPSCRKAPPSSLGRLSC